MSELEESYVWSTARDRGIRAFDGQTPRAEDEDAIIAVYRRHPALVERKIEDVALKFESGLA